MRTEFNPGDRAVQQKFTELKQLSKELLALMRLSSILPRMPSPSISPILARRLEMFVMRKDVADAGEIADFMASVLDSSHEQ